MGGRTKVNGDKGDSGIQKKEMLSRGKNNEKNQNSLPRGNVESPPFEIFKSKTASGVSRVP